MQAVHDKDSREKLRNAIFQSLSRIPTTTASIMSLSADPPGVSYSNGNIPTLNLHASKSLTDQNVATIMVSPFYLVEGKVLAKIMHTRHLEYDVDLVLLETPCGFRRGRGTMAMIFVARQLQEKCRLQHQDIYMTILDPTMAFDNYVNHHPLWSTLCKFCCYPTFIVMLQQFNTGMCAQLVTDGFHSTSFSVDVGMKQCCVLAKIIFNLFLVAMTLVSQCDLHTSNSIGGMTVVSLICDISRPRINLPLH